MGLVLVGMSLAVILAFPIAGQASSSTARSAMTWIGGIADALAVNLIVLAPHPLLVVAGLFVFGASSATMDVSMNSHGVDVERELGKPIMSSLHAGWSFGGMTGAGFAAGLAALGRRPAHRRRDRVGAAARARRLQRAPDRPRLGGRG